MGHFFILFFTIFFGSFLASLASCILNWRRMVFMGDALSHSSILGIGAAIILSYNIDLMVFANVVIFALLIESLKNNVTNNHIIAILSYLFSAIGFILMSVYKISTNVIFSFMLGDILLINENDLIAIIIFTIIFGIWYARNHKELLITIINEDMALARGINVNSYNLQMTLASAIIVAAIVKIFGTLLAGVILILPIAIARIFSKSIVQLYFVTSFLIFTISGLSIILSMLVDLPVGPLSTAISAIIYFISLKLKSLRFS